MTYLPCKAHTHTHIHMNICAYVFTYVQMCPFTSIYQQVYTYIYTYRRYIIYIYTYIDIDKQRKREREGESLSFSHSVDTYTRVDESIHPPIQWISVSLFLSFRQQRQLKPICMRARPESELPSSRNMGRTAQCSTEKERIV